MTGGALGGDGSQVEQEVRAGGWLKELPAPAVVLAPDGLQAIAEAVHDHIIVLLDTGGAIASWNAGAARLTGYRVDEIIRAHIAVLFAATPEEIAQQFSRAAIEKRAELVTRVRRQDHTTFPAHATIIAFSDPDHGLAGFGAVIRDLSELERTEERLRRSEEQLLHSQKMDAVGRLASGIAHDFKNMLTAIQGHAQFLLDDLPPDLPSRGDAEEILKAADSATDLTRRLLTFARKQPSRPAVVNPNALITDIEKLLRRLIRADVALETLLGDVPDILIDPGQLEQVIVNLVVNARDAIEADGRITIATSRVRFDEALSIGGTNFPRGDHVRVSVSDTGTGIDRDIQHHIFEPFFTTKGDGTGLGLSTVHAIVKQAGGHVSVHSEVGHGSTFKVFLPAHGVVQSRAYGRVLVIEDDESVRTMARRTLEAQGYAVLEAADSESAVRIANAHDRIDIVLSDVMLPESDGETLALQIAELRPEAGIVLMSGFPQPMLVKEGRIRSDGLFLEKPFTTSALVDVVGEAMRTRTPSAVRHQSS